MLTSTNTSWHNNPLLSAGEVACGQTHCIANLGPGCLQEKLRRRVHSVEVKVLHPPRRGKKCLVLDIDYTLFDLGSSAERPHELARPYLHQFLAAVWEHYDIVIWSATNMKWDVGAIGRET